MRTRQNLSSNKIFLLRFSMPDWNRDSFLSESWQKISSRERARGWLWFTWVLYQKGKWSKKDGSHNDKKVKRSTKPFVCAAGDQALYFPLFSAIFFLFYRRPPTTPSKEKHSKITKNIIYNIITKRQDVTPKKEDFI